MQRAVLAVLVALAACVLAKQPPTWPTAFSTGIDRIQKHPNKVQTGRWYYDVSLKSDRFDTHHGETAEIEINRYDLKTRYSIRYTAHQDPVCTSTQINGVMPVYSFSDWTYGGQQTIRGFTVDKWTRTTNGADFVYYDASATTDPVIFQRKVKSNEEFDEDHFYEFDRGSQDVQMFNVSYLFPEGCKPAAKKAPQPVDDAAVSLNATDSVGCSQVSCATMRGLVHKYFPGNYQTDMICIAYYESSWCPAVYNGICCYGLWQINSNHLGESGCPSSVNDLYNADKNGQCARTVLNSQGLNAWQTWTDGDCGHWSMCDA